MQQIVRFGFALAGVVAVPAFACAATETILYSFHGTNGQSACPQSPPVISSGGVLYGTTSSGGTHGKGMIYRLAEGVETRLYSFAGGSGGVNPLDGLVAASDGTYYGATASGGNDTTAPDGGEGTIYKITPGSKSSSEKQIYRFKDQADGVGPYGALAAGANGVLYGTTLYGAGYGTIFKLTPPAAGKTAWVKTILYGFNSTADGASPEAPLLIKDGALYGTATAGGGSNSSGTVFKLTPSAKGKTAWTATLLYAFKGTSSGANHSGDGAHPTGALIADASGALYGTTEYGGKGYGTVFKLSPPAAGKTEWSETVLYSFKGDKDGANPLGVIGVGDTLYGTTLSGGAYGIGTVFSIGEGKSDSETILHSFGAPNEPNDAAGTNTGLSADRNGRLYGVACYGGKYKQGSIFEIIP